MKRIAVIGIVLENPSKNQDEFNQIVSEYNEIVKGRMGLPFSEENIGVISLVVIADMDKINGLTGRLGKIADISVKAAVSKREI
ncbi:MAG: iron-only hydrogenase system regulator [Oscillospiraceae bacterium]|nr:iron-only hydrogenase system regulator [Oscillospiraceae bacterium]